MEEEGPLLEYPGYGTQEETVFKQQKKKRTNAKSFLTDAQRPVSGSLSFTNSD